MESNRIQLIEKFGICTQVVKYYGYAHHVFLLISRLNKKSREMMDKNYDGIINSLNHHAIIISISEDNKEMMFLPSDLFKFSISLKWEKTTLAFLQLISNIKEKNGYYFNKIFMHEKIWILSVYANIDQLDIIYPYLEDLKSINLANDRNFSNQEFKDDNSTLIDKFALTDKNNFKLNYNEIIFPYYSNRENKEINPIFNSFKRIFILFLNYFPYDVVISALNCNCYY